LAIAHRVGQLSFHEAMSIDVLCRRAAYVICKGTNLKKGFCREVVLNIGNIGLDGGRWAHFLLTK